MKPTLLILAAGMGSRYGGLKQMDKIGPSGESIIDYSIYDAIVAGFGKVVFVIRESFIEAFKERFEPRLKNRIEIEYVFQELNKIPDGFIVPTGREKPWGTGHAMLMAKDVINEPFAVINADDFYGRDAYLQAITFIENNKETNQYAMIGYALKNTLSEHGTVSRGVCDVNANNNIISIIERTKIGYENNKIFFYEDNCKTELTGNEQVSMNFWVFKPSFLEALNSGFKKFLHDRGSELTSEFYFNTQINNMIQHGEAVTKVLQTHSKWFGITYREDKPFVQNSILELVKSGIYPENLWKD
ncbi:MAG: sugar phosphate nucleotidyltransferase [Marinilabiliaceae bacterium]|nr:sugar phosphate nucleotidyltransferase [Marinilabiliaceae bacterium]